MHSTEALVTQTIKGIELLKNNTPVHTYFGELSSGAHELPEEPVVCETEMGWSLPQPLSSIPEMLSNLPKVTQHRHGGGRI